MTEQELMAKHQKRKDRIKNIAIIFLVIMLLLTFFSNTIMNYSLAEVGTAYASSGTLTTKIRGDASVEAKDPVQVMVEQEAKVLKVLVKNGDKVKKGKTLFVLEGASSEELETAENELLTLNHDHQKALLDIKVPDYAKNNSDIKYARKDLKQALKAIDDIRQEKKEKKLEYKKLKKDADKAKKEMDEKADLVADKETEIAEIDIKLEDYQEQQTELSDGTNDDILEKEAVVTSAKRAVADAQAAEEQYKSERTTEVIDAEMKEKNKKIASLQSELETLQLELTDAQNAGTDSAEITSLTRSIRDKKTEISDINSEITKTTADYNAEEDEEKKKDYEKDLADLRKDLKNAQQALEDLQDDLSKAQSSASTENTANIKKARKAVNDKQNEIAAENQELSELLKEFKEAGTREANLKSAQSITSSYEKIQKAAERALEDAQAALKKENMAQLSELKTKIKEIKMEKAAKENEKAKLDQDYTQAQEVYTEAKTVLDSFQQVDDTALETARQAAVEKEKALAAALSDLATAQKDDSLNEQLALLESDTTQEQIKMKEEQIAELKKEAKPQKLKAGSAGIVQSVTVKAGDMAAADVALAEIQVKKNGFQLSVPVTIDQSKLVKKGDHASILNLWDDSVKAVLADIKTDQENPNAGRTLVFDVSGNVENGTMLSISVGEKTANYDLIVPTSAIREDSDGKFVLIIEEKPSPVGNRYIARKEEVSIITQDETQSAVTGSFDSYTSIITTASKSVEPGDYVRLAS